MSIPRLLVTLALVLLATLLAALCYINYANLDRHRTRLETMLSDATGRQTRIAGAIDVDLWPSIRLEMNDLSMANAPWGSEPQMASISHASAAVAPLSLLSDTILIENFQLRGVALLLESNEDGGSNLPLAESTLPEEGTEAPVRELRGLPALVDTAVLHDIVLTLRKQGVEDQVLQLDEMSIDSRESDRLSLALKGQILTLPLQLSGHIGTLLQLTDLGAGDFTAAGELGPMTLELDGHLGNMNSLSGSELQAKVDAQAIEQVFEALGLTLPFSGPLSLAAEFKAEGDSLKGKLDAAVNKLAMDANISLNQLVATVDANLSPMSQLGTLFEVEGLPEAPATIKGAVEFTDDAVLLKNIIATLASAELVANGTLAGGDSASTIKLTARGSSLAELMTSLPTVGFDASTTVELAATRVTLKPLKAQLGNSDIAGSVQLDTADGTDIQARLASDMIDLDQFGGEPAGDDSETAEPGAEPGTAAAPGTDAPPPPAAADEPATESKYVFTEKPLPWDALQKNDLDIEWSVKALVSSALPLNNLEIDSTLHQGDLQASIDFDTVNGGAASGQIQLTSANEQADLKVMLQAHELRINLLGGDIDVEHISKTDLTLNLESKGSSPRDLAANSNGMFLLTQGPGRVDNKLIGTATTDVFAQLASSLNPFAEQEPYSIFECGIIAMEVVDGQSTLDPIILQQEKVMIVAGGKIDLDTEDINLEFNTKPRAGIGVSADMFVTPFVSLKGTLASPSIGVNETGTLLAAGAAGAAIATGGLSLLVQGAFNRAQGEVDHCEKTLPEHPHPPMTKQQSATTKNPPSA